MFHWKLTPDYFVGISDTFSHQHIAAFLQDIS